MKYLIEPYDFDDDDVDVVTDCNPQVYSGPCPPVCFNCDSIAYT